MSIFVYNHLNRYATEEDRCIKTAIDRADFECLFMQQEIEKLSPYDGVNY